MSKSKSLQVGVRHFPTRIDAKNEVRKIIAEHKNGEIIEGEDDVFLRNLILLHSEADEKIGCGIDYFTVGLAVGYPSRCIVIVRLDGSSTDASCVKNCIDGKNHRGDVLSALRHAVFDQVSEFKIASFRAGKPVTCPYLDQVLSETNCHVDHVAPYTFKALVEAWMQRESLVFDQIKLVDNQDHQYVNVLRDQKLIDSWKKFHSERARLRIVSSLANLSYAKKVIKRAEGNVASLMLL